MANFLGNNCTSQAMCGFNGNYVGGVQDNMRNINEAVCCPWKSGVKIDIANDP